MSTENLAYRQERTSFIVYHIPSYIRAIRQNESDEFLKTLMAGFIARFPMDLLGLPQLEPLRLTEVDPKLQHPHEMVEVTVKGHLNDLQEKYIKKENATAAGFFAGYDSLLFASAQVLTNFTFHFRNLFVEVSDWRHEMRKATESFDIFWRMPVGFAEAYGYKCYKWSKGGVCPISTAKPEDDWLYVLPQDVDKELLAEDRISEQEFIKSRFLKLFESLDKAFQERRYRTASLPKFNEVSHVQPCQMLSVKGVVNVDVDEETIERCWSAVNEDPTNSKADVV